MEKSALIAKIKQEVRTLDSYLDPEDYSNACNDASKETGWSFPVSGDFKELWIKERAKRYLFFYLLTENAHKFKVEQINLQHRFDHYRLLIQDMDKAYKDVQEERPDMFGAVDPFHMFGTKIDAGFRYDEVTGADLTYDSDSEVEFTPKEND